MTDSRHTKLPPVAKWHFIMGIISAFDNTLRQQIIAHLFEARTKSGLRTSEIAEKTGRPADQISKQLRTLEQALLVRNEVGKSVEGVYSRYQLTDLGAEWLVRLELKDDGRLLPLMVPA